MKQYRHYIISGRVQGVFFRQATMEKARSLGITGWARNLNNGDVEIQACGDELQISDLESWLWQGPPQAKVNNVVAEKSDTQDFNDFVIRY